MEPRCVVDPQFRHRLRQLREERGLTTSGLAKRANFTYGYVWELEDGRRKKPTKQTAQVLDAALDAHGILAALVTELSDAQQRNAPADADDQAVRASVEEAEELRQAISDAVSASAMSDASLEDWEQAVLDYGRKTRYKPATILLGELVDDFRELPRKLRQFHTSSTLQRMTRVTAQMAGLVFLTFIKLDNRSAARSWARTARVAADEAGDRALQSWVRAQEAYVHYYSGDLHEAIDVARHAQYLAGRTACVGLSLAAALEGRALGIVGDAEGTDVAIGRAESALAKLSPDSVTASAFGYNKAQLRFHQGNALTHLRDTERAWPAQRRALDLYPESDYMDRALVCLDRANCLAHDGDADAAMLYATQTMLSLSGDQRAGLITARGHEILAGLTVEQRALPAARDFHEVLMLPPTEEDL